MQNHLKKVGAKVYLSDDEMLIQKVTYVYEDGEYAVITIYSSRYIYGFDFVRREMSDSIFCLYKFAKVIRCGCELS